MNDDKLLRRQEVEAITGFACSSIYRLMRAGLFPEPVKIGPKSVRWRASEIEAWLASLPRASGEAAA